MKQKARVSERVLLAVVSICAVVATAAAGLPNFAGSEWIAAANAPVLDARGEKGWRAADGRKVGFWNEGWENRFLGCSYFNNKKAYGLEDVLIVKQPGGTMLFADGFFHKSCDKIRIYEGNGRIAWKNMQYSHFGDGRELPGKCAYDPTGAPEIELGR